jgi:hypothetical protein
LPCKYLTFYLSLQVKNKPNGGIASSTFIFEAGMVMNGGGPWQVHDKKRSEMEEVNWFFLWDIYPVRTDA